MITRRHIASAAIGIVLAAAAAMPAVADSGRPPSMSPAQYRALMTRSEALNVLYGLGKPTGMTHAQYRAELIRAAALNERYGLPVALTSNEIASLYGTRIGETAPAEVSPVQAVAPSDGFDWMDAAIGAVFASGLFLLGAGGAGIVRRHGHIGHARH